jgi:hypothetical protein
MSSVYQLRMGFFKIRNFRIKKQQLGLLRLMQLQLLLKPQVLHHHHHCLWMMRMDEEEDEEEDEESSIVMEMMLFSRSRFL